MNFCVVPLGTGAAIPTIERHPSAMLVRYENNYFLIDCGEGTQMQLLRFGLKAMRISHVLISHLHGDHFFGLIGLISSYHLLGRSEPLYIYADKALEEIIKLQLQATQTQLCYPLEFVAFKEPSELLVDLPMLSIHSFPLDHRIPARGFIFQEKPKPRKIRKEVLEKFSPSIEEIRKIKEGEDFISPEGKILANKELTLDPPPPRSFAYCSDTRFSPEIVSFIQDVNLLYHEATFLEDLSDAAWEKYHSTVRQAATIALMANAKKLMLGHFSARYQDSSIILKDAREIFPNTILAEEGQKVCL